MNQKFRTSMLLASAALLLLGLVLIIWPTTSQRILCGTLGLICIAVGVIRLIGQWRLSHSYSFHPAYLAGLLLVLLGALLLLNSDAVIAVFGALMGVVLTAASAVNLQSSFRMKHLFLPQWKAHAIVSAVLLAFGLVLLFDPFKGLSTMTVITGIVLVLSAAINIWSVIALRKDLIEA